MCAKIVQVEDNKKEKTKFFHFLLLRRRLSYVKIVFFSEYNTKQGENMVGASKK